MMSAIYCYLPGHGLFSQREVFFMNGSYIIGLGVLGMGIFFGTVCEKVILSCQMLRLVELEWTFRRLWFVTRLWASDVIPKVTI